MTLRRRKRERRAGSLFYDSEAKQWVQCEARPEIITREQVRLRALTDGLHTGFILGWGAASAFFMVVGVILLGT